MSVKRTLQSKLERAFRPSHVEVIDESHRHNVPPGAESHFRVTVVSDAFDGEGLVARHRAVYRTLDDELRGSVHALAVHTYTPAEWSARAGTPESPPCLGGDKRG